VGHRLPLGDQLRLLGFRNCLDIAPTISMATPVARTVFDGKSVGLPMRKAPECPEFDAFLVLPEWE